jgi:thiol-disulfide isomerase/thioredoxin
MTSFYDSLLHAQEKELKSLKSTGSRDFIDYLHYTMLGLNYSQRFNYLSKFDTIAPSSESYAFLENMVFSDSNALIAKEYVNMQIQVLPSLLQRHGKDHSLDQAYKFLGEEIGGDAYLKYARSIFLLFNYSSLSNTTRLAILEEFEKDYSGRIPLPVVGMFDLMPGKQITDFEVKNEQGELVKLSDFNDRLVLVDFWATWCAPCIKEEPFIYEIAENYSSSITVLSINLDKSKEKWRLHISELDMLPNILHFNIDKGFNSRFAQQFYLSGVPRYMLIGRGNVILDAFAPNPSSDELGRMIEERQ